MEKETISDIINIAIVGCAHGELDLIYKSVLQEEREKGLKVDLLICCGDFECARNDKDLLYVEGIGYK
jgi:lariat debranching enzyme